MMAAAMTTRKSRAPTYIDLARAGAVVERELPAAACGRLAEVVVALEPVQLRLHFAFDDQQRMRVAGTVSTLVSLECQLCTEPVPLTLSARLDSLLAADEAQAEQWRAVDEDADIIVATSPELDAAELVEDELLLQLPSQICVDVECERRPPLRYGAAEVPEDDRQRPFAALAQLKMDNPLPLDQEKLDKE